MLGNRWGCKRRRWGEGFEMTREDGALVGCGHFSKTGSRSSVNDCHAWCVKSITLAYSCVWLLGAPPALYLFLLYVHVLSGRSMTLLSIQEGWRGWRGGNHTRCWHNCQSETIASAQPRDRHAWVQLPALQAARSWAVFNICLPQVGQLWNS